MAEYGLLHSVPETISNAYPELQQLVDQCIGGNMNGDRFVTVNKLLELFNKIVLEV